MINDAEGLRYAVTENGKTTNFVYRNGMPVSELDADKNPVRGYILGNEYISQVDGTSFGYYLNDEQGSVRYLTGSDGSIRNHYRYSAFGETITAEETVPNRLRYNGQMADGLTGLYYLRARYYNASLGRFTQEEVIYNDGLNLYAYCNSNPVMYSDPSGFATKSTQPTQQSVCKRKNGGEKDSKSGNSSRAYQSTGRMSDDLLLNPKTNTNGTNNLTEWRRSISKADIKAERIKFLGEDAVKVDGGVWRSLDGTRQFRVVESDYFGGHGIGSPLVPNIPHVHFEFLGMPNAGENKLKVIKNVHVPLK